MHLLFVLLVRPMSARTVGVARARIVGRRSVPPIPPFVMLRGARDAFARFGIVQGGAQLFAALKTPLPAASGAHEEFAAHTPAHDVIASAVLERPSLAPGALHGAACVRHGGRVLLPTTSRGVARCSVMVLRR